MTSYLRHTLNEEAPVVVVDLDSTLADTRHRRHLAPAENRDLLESWEPYSMACPGDTVIPGLRHLVRLLSLHHNIFLLSSRNDCAEQLTLNWLADNAVPFDTLRLRAPHEQQATPSLYKVAVLKAWQAEGWDIQLFIDDWVETCIQVEAYTGIPTIAPAFQAGGYKPGH